MAQEWNVGMMMGISGAYWQGCALQAAVRLKFFTHLGDEPLDAAAVARRACCDGRATGLLMDALSAMGLLEKRGDCYQNSAFTKKHLIVGADDYMGHIVLHHHQILDGWAQLDLAVQTGHQVNRRSYGDEVEQESFLLGMFNVAKGIAPKLAAEFDLKGRRKLLDLGGGPGTYAIHFCLRNPDLQAVIFDRPGTEPFARETVGHFGLTDRIDFLGGDFNSDSVGGGPYDVAWLSHILHSNSFEECEECITKTVAALSPGGLIMVHEFVLDDTKDGPLFPALFSLNMLVGTRVGRSYSHGEIVSMLEKAGVLGISQRKCDLPNDSSVIYGVKR
jgi:hypothetical protein